MKDIYYKMKAWLVVKRLEKNETDFTSGSTMQDKRESEENDLSENHNSFQ